MHLLPERRLLAAAFLVWMIVGSADRTSAQTIAIAGRAVDAATGSAVPGAKVTVGGRTATTDEQGRFRIDVTSGTWEIQISARDYMSRTVAVDVPVQGLAPIEIALIPRERFKERVDVTAAAPRSQEPAALPLRPAQVLSTAGSLDNPFRTLQTLPGVAGTDELGSKLAVRGGAPDQNLTMMDGVEIHNPYRLFGITSAFNPETVSRFELLAGGFGAKYGDRLSSVIIVENRDGDATRAWAASSSASITDANIVGEGRLPGPGSGSWLATARRTYYDLVAERFIDQDLPSFNDLQVKTSWHLPRGSRLSLLGLRSREITRIQPEEESDGRVDIHSRSDLLTATLVAPVAHATATTIVSWSHNSDLIDVQDEQDESASGAERDQFNRQLAIRDVSWREEIALPQVGRHRLEAGTDWHRLQTHVAFATNDDLDPFGLLRGGSVWLGGVFPHALDHARSTTRGGAWIEDRARISSSITIVPGVRWDWSGLNGRTSLSPRLSAVAALNTATRLTAATGVYTQSPGYEKLLEADHFTDLTAAGQLNLRPERSTHVVGGLERDFAHGVTARAEAYYKTFEDLIVGRLETEDERLARLARYRFPPALAPALPTAALITAVPTNDGRGEAYGLDLFLSRAAGAAASPLTGWISYSLGKTSQEIYGRQVPFSYDRRHSLSVVWNWRIGRRLELAGTARAASGFPRTPPSGIRPATVEVGSRLFPIQTGPSSFLVEVAPGGAAELNSARMPTFARTDLRLGYHPPRVNSRWEVYVESLNVLKRNNAWFVDANVVNDSSAPPRLREEPVGGLPRVVTFGLRFRIR